MNDDLQHVIELLKTSCDCLWEARAATVLEELSNRIRRIEEASGRTESGGQPKFP